MHVWYFSSCQSVTSAPNGNHLTIKGYKTHKPSSKPPDQSCHATVVAVAAAVDVVVPPRPLYNNNTCATTAHSTTQLCSGMKFLIPTAILLSLGRAQFVFFGNQFQPGFQQQQQTRVPFTAPPQPTVRTVTQQS